MCRNLLKFNYLASPLPTTKLSGHVASQILEFQIYIRCTLSESVWVEQPSAKRNKEKLLLKWEQRTWPLSLQFFLRYSKMWAEQLERRPSTLLSPSTWLQRNSSGRREVRNALFTLRRKNSFKLPCATLFFSRSLLKIHAHYQCVSSNESLTSLNFKEKAWNSCLRIT